jgi:hypothetical protein
MTDTEEEIKQFNKFCTHTLVDYPIPMVIVRFLILAWIKQTARAEKAEFVMWHGLLDAQCTICPSTKLDVKHNWTTVIEPWITAVKERVGWKD